MEEKIIATFCLCDDLLKATWHQESSFPQQLNDAEIMTIAPGSSPGQALVAASCFQGRHDPARFMLAQHGYIPGKISKSRFNRRLHRLKDTVATIFDFLGQLWKTLDTEGVYVIDSFPVAVCDNVRIRRAKLYQDETSRGYQASKRRYFYGLKIHLVVTSSGQPVECVLTPGSVLRLRSGVTDRFSRVMPTTCRLARLYMRIRRTTTMRLRTCLPRWSTSICFRYARRIQSAHCLPRRGIYSPIIASGWRRRGVS